MSQKASKKIIHPDWKVAVDGPIRIATGLYRKGDIVCGLPERAARQWGAALTRVKARKTTSSPAVSSSAK